MKQYDLYRTEEGTIRLVDKQSRISTKHAERLVENGAERVATIETELGRIELVRLFRKEEWDRRKELEDGICKIRDIIAKMNIL